MRGLEGEDGFTLVEALVAMLMMVAVMFALYAVFDASVRVFKAGNDETEAVENARLAMERMEREIRAASVYDPSSEPPKDHLFFRFSSPSQPTTPPEIPTSPSNSLAFGNDANGMCGLLTRSSGGGCETEPDEREIIAYYVNANGLLVRRNNNQFVSVVENVRSLELAYADSEGDEVFDEAGIEVVRISLVVRVGGRSQTLSTDVALRNRAD